MEKKLDRIADELMISNIITILNNPNLSKEFLAEDRIKLLTIVKEHILKNVETLNPNEYHRKR